jgi:hypothetical protein
VLAAVGQGSWHPGNDATLWVKFNLRAHHMQAQTCQCKGSGHVGRQGFYTSLTGSAVG